MSGQHVWLTFSAYSLYNDTQMIIPIKNPESFQKEADAWPYKRFKADVEDSFMTPEKDELHYSQYNYNVSPKGGYEWQFIKSLEELFRTDSVTTEAFEKCDKNFPDCGFLLIKLQSGKARYGPICWSHAIDGTEPFIPVAKADVGKHSDLKVYTIGANVNTYKFNHTRSVPKKSNNVRWDIMTDEFDWGTGSRWSLWERSL